MILRMIYVVGAPVFSLLAFAIVIRAMVWLEE